MAMSDLLTDAEFGPEIIRRLNLQATDINELNQSLGNALQ